MEEGGAEEEVVAREHFGFTPQAHGGAADRPVGGELEDPIAYLKRIKLEFQDEPGGAATYELFLEVLRNYEEQQIPITRLLSHLRDLFGGGHEHLLFGFNTLLHPDQRVSQAEIDRILLARDGAAAASPEGGAGNSSFDESELAAVAARAAEHSTAARIDAAEQLARPGAAEEK